MTKEDLEELEALARDLKRRTANLLAAAGMDAFVPKAPQAADLLLRLLDERQRLLAATCLAATYLSGFAYDAHGEQIRAAIAFAEEAAR